MPSVTDVRCFSPAFTASHSSLTAAGSRPSAEASPKTWGLRRTIFAVMSEATWSRVNAPDSSAITAWK